VASEAELEFWRSVRASNKLEELNVYLATYPNGQFRSLALSRVAALTESATAAPADSQLAATDDPNAGTQATEDQIGLTKILGRDVQRQLTALGLDTNLTGMFDGATRAVIKRWQAAHDYIVTGFLSDSQYRTLMAGASPSSSSSTADASDDRPSRKTYRTASAGGRQAPNPFAGPQQFFGAMFGGGRR
jgi:peptidoglycan hydrolase-like protein with peptidoglycan-binding domain